MSGAPRLRRADAEVARTLVACVRDPEDPGVAAAVGELAGRGRLHELLGLAERHRVLGSLARPLQRAAGVPEEDRRAVEARVARAAARNLRVLEDLRCVAAALEGLPWLVTKGPALAETVYPAPELRPYGDLDLVVEPGAFRDAVAALEGAGATVEDRNWRLLAREGRGQLHLRLPHGTLADLHWHLVNRASVRRAFRIPMAALFARARRADVAGVRAPVLEPTDALLHVALHAALSGGNRLLWLQDVAMLLDRGGVDLEALVRRARRWRVGTPVAIVLERAARSLGAPIEPNLLRALERSPVRRSASATLDRIWPTERSVGGDPAGLWAQLARDTWSETLLAVWLRARRALAPSPGPEGHAGLVPSGGEHERERFFALAADYEDPG